VNKEIAKPSRMVIILMIITTVVWTLIASLVGTCFGGAVKSFMGKPIHNTVPLFLWNNCQGNTFGTIVVDAIVLLLPAAIIYAINCLYKLRKIGH